MGKASISTIAKGYLRTLHKGTTGSLSVLDVAFQVGFPVLVGLAFLICALTGKLPDVVRLVESLFLTFLPLYPLFPLCFAHWRS